MSVTPAYGSPKILVIPVWFNDSNTIISIEKREQVREDIQTAYLGTNEEAGWRSVKTYYEEESHGKLTLNGTVSDWYEENAKYSTYGPEQSGLTKTTQLVEKATKWYFEQNPTEKRTDYDSDADGYLDGVMLIYAAPNYSHTSNQYKNLWAYCYWLFNENYKNTFNPGPNVFFWASFDFMYSANKMAERTGLNSSIRYASGDTSHSNVDTHTFIHEMGHVFGLDDYYDYSGQYSPAGSFSMQDQNVGGHDPFSSFALGWGQAYIPTESMTLYIKPFTQSGEMIILSPSWNKTYDSAFDEYLIIEYYTADGLNELDTTYAYCGSSPTGSQERGIRLWHVDARLAKYNSFAGAFELANTVNPAAASPASLMFSNTYEGEYADYHLLHLIRNKTTTPFNSKTPLRSEHLFKLNSAFNMSTYASQFINSSLLNNGKSLGYSFSVDSLRSEYAKITITKA